MRVTHSVGTDQAYIAFKEIGHGEVASTHTVLDQPAGGRVHLDFSAEGRLIGIDVAAASRLLPPELLEGAERIDRELRLTTEDQEPS